MGEIIAIAVLAISIFGVGFAFALYTIVKLSK